MSTLPVLYKGPSVNRGFSMIELLVAMVLLSGSVLGFAALQVTGLHASNSAGYRTQAAVLINDLTERMRNNMTGVNANQYNAQTIDSTACTSFPNPYCEDYHGGSASTCTPAQLAAFDVNVWFCGIRSGSGRAGGVVGSLPNATAVIDVDNTDSASGAPIPDSITLQWRQQAQGAAGIAIGNKSITLTVTL